MSLYGTWERLRCRIDSSSSRVYGAPRRGGVGVRVEAAFEVDVSLDWTHTAICETLQKAVMLRSVRN